MPSGVTHILLVKHLQEQLQPDDILRHRLAAARDFFQVGAVAPDLPYASIADDDFFFETESDLADKFHYEKTNAVPLLALQRIHARKAELSQPDLRSFYAFFIGYVSHVIADGLVHPFVRDTVGDYHEHQTEHRVLEMQLDVLFYRFLNFRSGSPGEFNYSNIHKELKNLTPQQYPILSQVMTLFRDTIRDVYGTDHDYDIDTIQGWITGLYRMFDIAEGEHPAIYRDIGLISDFLFPTYDELRQNAEDLLTVRKPIDREENFLHKPRIHFFDDAVPKFYEVFIPIARKAHDAIFGDGPLLDENDVPPIDLDTGRYLANNSLDEVPPLWT